MSVEHGEMERETWREEMYFDSEKVLSFRQKNEQRVFRAAVHFGNGPKARPDRLFLGNPGVTILLEEEEEESRGPFSPNSPSWCTSPCTSPDGSNRAAGLGAGF